MTVSMSTLLAAAKAFVVLVAAIGFCVFWIRKRVYTQKLDQGIEKSKKTGDTSDVENIFGGPPQPPQP